MLYRYETHCHCSQASLCARNTAQEMVQAYYDAGYAGLVLTDHFIFGNTAVDRNLPWDARMRCYWDAYLQAKEAAEGLDFDVIFGIEHAYGDGKEMLIYGVELDFLLANPDFPEITIDEIARRVHEAGGVVIQAHPYRDRWYVNMAVGPRTDLIDGIEVYNAGNKRQEDIQALALAQSGDYIITSGGDIHISADPHVGCAGVLFPHRVRNSQEFARALQEKKHSFLVNGRVVSQITQASLE